MATTSNPVNITNVTNITWRHDHDHSLVKDEYKPTLLAMGSISACLTIVINLTLLVVILSSREMRRSVFHWNIVNMCVAGLLIGLVVIPFTTNRYHVEQWLHGSQFCAVFSVFEYTQLTFPAMSIICIHFNRFAKLQRRKNPLFDMKCFQLNILQYVFFAFPWVFLVLICIPVLVAGRREFQHSYAQYYCFTMLKDEYTPVIFGMLLIGPLCSLVLLCIITSINLKLSEIHWRRMSETESDSSEVEYTRSTVKCLLASSAFFFLSWMPLALTILSSYICGRYIRKNCYPSALAFLVTSQLGSFAVSGMQLPWFWLPDIRAILSDFRQTGDLRVRQVLVDVRRALSNGKMVVGWSSKQSELIHKENE